MLASRANWTSTYLSILIPALAVALAGLAAELGVDPRLATIFCLLLFLWPLQVVFEGPSPDEDAEYAYLRTIRTKLTFAGLLFLIVVNTVVTISILLSLILVLVASGGLRIIYHFIMRREVIFHELQGKKEEDDFKEMYLSTGGAIIYLSSVFVVIDFLLIAKGTPSVNFPAFTLACAAAGVFLGNRAWNREGTARKHARLLADSLHRREWWKRFERR